MNKQPRIGSLFSGYLGLDLGVRSVFPDAREAWVSDVGKGANKILAHRVPDVPNLGDVTRVDWASVEPVDILTGGSPCQDLSVAGRRAGMAEGTRSGLWASMREAIAALQPRLIVWENVRGALSASATSALEHCPRCMGGAGHGGRDLRAFGRVLGDLADLGYDAQWHGLQVSDLGGCHRRWRVFVVAYAHGARLQGQPDQAGAAPAERHRHPVAGAGRPDLTLLPTPTASDTNGPGAHGTGGADLRTAIQLLPTPTAVTRDRSPEELERRWIDGERGAHGRNLDDLTAHIDWGDYAAAIASHERLTGRPAPDPTEPGPKGNPRLSAKFVEFMMCLPDGWVTDVPGVTRNEALKALGNGVVPLQAAHAIALCLSRASRTPPTPGHGLKTGPCNPITTERNHQ